MTIDHLKHRFSPFEGLRQDGVIGVGAALGGDVPGVLPAQALLVHQDPHQLGHRQCRVRVI